nr:hypothetical protein [Tanacetum cinerariifolium]
PEPSVRADGIYGVVCKNQNQYRQPVLESVERYDYCSRCDALPSPLDVHAICGLHDASLHEHDDLFPASKCRQRR